MKYEINLLPPAALEARMAKVQSHRKRTIFLAFLVACVIVFLSYGGVWWALRSLKGTVSDDVFLQNKDKEVITDAVKKVNREIVLLDQRINSYTQWTAHIPDIVLAAPAGILISRLELVEESETFVVTGTASQGSAVVLYQAALERLPWVEYVVAPLQNFARAPDATVTFTIFHKKPFVP